MEFSKNTWPAFIEKLQNLVHLQQSDFHHAIYGSGEYRLAHELSSFHVEQIKWQAWSTKQKENHIKKMIDAVHNKADVECVPNDPIIEQLDARMETQLSSVDKTRRSVLTVRTHYHITRNLG